MIQAEREGMFQTSCFGERDPASQTTILFILAYEFDYFLKFQGSSSKRKRQKTESATVLINGCFWFP